MRASTSLRTMASLSPVLASRSARLSDFSTDSRSARASSMSIVSMSAIGSTLPATWMMSVCSKQRTTWAMASTSRMWARNLLPRPSPLDAPATRPAMSTNSNEVGMVFCGLTISASCARRGSGTGTTPVLGSMVQNGKLAAAMPALVSALKRVDLPTFGRPTMPHLMPMVTTSGSRILRRQRAQGRLRACGLRVWGCAGASWPRGIRRRPPAAAPPGRRRWRAGCWPRRPCRACPAPTG